MWLFDLVEAKDLGRMDGFESCDRSIEDIVQIITMIDG